MNGYRHINMHIRLFYRFLTPPPPFLISGGQEMGEKEKQAQDELWETEPWPPLLLWQKHHPQDSGQALRVPLCVWPAEPPGVHARGAPRHAGCQAGRRWVTGTWGGQGISAETFQRPTSLDSYFLMVILFLIFQTHFFFLHSGVGAKWTAAIINYVWLAKESQDW